MDHPRMNTYKPPRSPAEEKLITRLRRVLGKNLNQSDIDFLHVLVLPDVIDYTIEYVKTARFAER